MEHFYAYFIFAAILAFFLVFRSDAKYKFELFFLSFFLLTGNLNRLLTVKIPGFSLVEIQPLRFVYLLLFFFILRKTVLSREKLEFASDKKIPWFQVALYAYVLWVTVSVLFNSNVMEISEVLVEITDAIAFLILMISMRLMADKPSYDLIGKSIIIGAVFSSIISLVQLSIDPYFLRIGDARAAFGDVLRSNGIFSTEYFNSYYLIIAIAWTLTTIKIKYLKFGLVVLFALGVLSSFQRMSWIILFLIILTYMFYVQKLPIGKLILLGLTGIAMLLSVSIFYFQDIKKSSIVKERLSESINSRAGYYQMVLDNIGDKPIFGYGDLKNEVYYVNMMRITENRERALAQAGDLHSGYFSALFLFGIPAFISFTLFVLLSVFYYARSLREHTYFVIPFLVSIIYLIGNLTNTFLFLKYIAVLYAIHIGIGMGINHLTKQITPKSVFK